MISAQGRSRKCAMWDWLFTMRILPLLGAIALCGCDGSRNRRPIAPNFEVELVEGNSVFHTPGNVRLYYTPSSRKPTCVWSYIVGRTPAVEDTLVVFNGGLSDDKRWGVYPATLASQAQGPAVEISKTISRKVNEGVEYSFRLVAYTNDQFQFQGVQRPPVDTTKPLNVHVELSKEQVLSAMEETRKRGEKRTYDKLNYFIEP